MAKTLTIACALALALVLGGVAGCSTDGTDSGGPGGSVSGADDGVVAGGDAAGDGARTFSLPGDPCIRCVLGEGDQPDCVPADVGTPCTSEDCCVGEATCQPCRGSACPPSGLSCQAVVPMDCGTGEDCVVGQAQCVDGECTCTRRPVLDGAPCKGDNQKCTIGDTCQGGVCIAGEEASLESDNPCVNLVCVKGEVEEQPLSGTCSDGDPCTEGDRCALGQCVPDKLVDCPTTPCASTTWCDSEAGKCLSELKPDGSECESENSCVARATCESGQCVAHETIPCDDGNSCTEDTCELGEGGQPDCAQVTLPDDTVCEGLGYCSGGACVAPGSNQPPSAPAVRVDPAEPTPGAALTCVIDQASVDPEGQTVTYEYSWLRNGEATDHEGETVEAGGTAACETWTCVVTPRAERFPGPVGRDEVLIAPDGSGPTPSNQGVHSFPPQGGTFANWGAGEAFASRISFPAASLPYALGSVHGVLPAGSPWSPVVWADSGGAPGAQLATGPSVTGQGGTALQRADLSSTVTVTAAAGAVWIGFISNSGGITNPAGPVPYDADGSSTSNYIFGSYIDLVDLFGGCLSPCCKPATDHEPAINDWVVEAGPPGESGCP